MTEKEQEKQIQADNARYDEELKQLLLEHEKKRHQRAKERDPAKPARCNKGH